MAVSFHKLVAERGVWDDDLLRDAEAAWNSGTERGKEIAMLKWRIAAEQGFEIAQNNLAFILDQGWESSCSVPVSVPAAQRFISFSLQIRAYYA